MRLTEGLIFKKKAFNACFIVHLKAVFVRVKETSEKTERSEIT